MAHLPFTSMLVAAAAAPAAMAQDVALARAGDLASICAYSACVEADPSVVAAPRQAVARLDAGALLPEGFEPSFPRTGAVARAEAARDYARARAALVVETYLVRVSTQAFAAVEYVSEAAALTLVAGERVPLFDGSVGLSVGGTSVFSIDLSQRDLAAILDRHALGELYVDLSFQLASAADPWSPLCDPDGALRVAFVDAELAAGAGDPATPTGAPRTLVGLPSADVFGVESTGGLSVSATELAGLDLETSLANCYVLGLVRNRALTGAAVFSFRVDPAGAIASPAVEVDVLGDEAVLQCSVAAVDRLRVLPAGSWSSVRASVRFTPGTPP